IGIENYRDLPQAEFAVRDAKITKEYLIRVMGFPEENIVSLLNERATKGDIEGYMGTWLKNNVERDSAVFIYYAGHGAPNPLTGEAFIIPFDGNPAFPEATGIPLKNLYQKLADLNVKETFVVMDSCFSGGGGRSVMAKVGRPMAISVENPVLASGNVVVMTAASGTEISSSYPEKRHGLFTYFFLKGLQGDADFNGDKTVSLAELYNYVTPQVKKIAKERQMEQTPVLLPGIDLLGDKATLPLGKVSK
ncbi:MAG: caspase family protein, partial [Deltaproteobacteria bacterium]|nr:caspase family protein [Deltaproteobacteria bacterium]